jgi:uncharacterized protein (DUF58 family)
VTRLTSPRVPAYAALAALGLLAGLALGRVEPVVLAAPFLLAVATAALFGEEEPELSVEIELDRESALEGEELVARVEVSSSRAVARCELLLPAPPGLGVVGGHVRTLRLAAGEPRTVEFVFRCERWGAFGVGPLLVRTRDVFGFRSWEGVAGTASAIRVYPREETLRTLIQPLETLVFAGNQVSRARGEGIEFANMREWRPGDHVRRVNWRASALRRSLWVNEQHPERNTDVVLFLDAIAEARSDDASTHDRAVRAAATLARGYLERRDRVGLIGFGGNLTWLLPQAGLRQLYAIVDVLLRSDIVHSFARRRVDLLPPRTLPAKALVLAITPLLDDRSAAALLDLRGRGYDLVVIEVSPLELTAPAPGDPLELAHRVWRLSREALRWQFEQAGIPVVTWRDDMPLAVPIEEVRSFRHLARPA